MDRPLRNYDELNQLSLSDVEGIRLILRGGSVIDWHRLNFQSGDAVNRFILSHGLNPDEPEDVARMEAVKCAAIEYLRRHFEFPIPRPVAERDFAGLLMLASGKGHRQLCACTILKVMHIIHHLEGRELLFMLPTSDEELYHLVEQKVYRVIGAALAEGYPIVEFIGGRKNRDSLYTKLLSKKEASAAQIYDKLRFRIVTRNVDDVFPILKYLGARIFPFSYVIPGESHNTLFNFRRYCDESPNLQPYLKGLQLSPDFEEQKLGLLDNDFSSAKYKVAHFCADVPIRLSDDILATAPKAAQGLGRIVYAQVEFQMIDKASDEANELGDASHSAYKERQKLAVMQRLKVGIAGTRAAPGPGGRTSQLPPPPDDLSSEITLLPDE